MSRRLEEIVLQNKDIRRDRRAALRESENHEINSKEVKECAFEEKENDEEIEVTAEKVETEIVVESQDSSGKKSNCHN